MLIIRIEWREGSHGKRGMECWNENSGHMLVEHLTAFALQISMVLSLGGEHTRHGREIRTQLLHQL